MRGFASFSATQQPWESKSMTGNAWEFSRTNDNHWREVSPCTRLGSVVSGPKKRGAISSLLSCWNATVRVLVIETPLRAGCEIERGNLFSLKGSRTPLLCGGHGWRQGGGAAPSFAASSRLATTEVDVRLFRQGWVLPRRRSLIHEENHVETLGRERWNERTETEFVVSGSDNPCGMSRF
jgi:hypothetical protein